MPKKRQRRVLFFDERGKFASPKKRYTEVKMIMAYRGGQYVRIVERTPTPKLLADLLNHREFEALPEALVKIKSFKPRSKYAAWNLAEQIDQTKRLRRKDIKFTMKIMDGGRLKTIEFYHRIKRNTNSSYAIFRRINQEIGIEGFHLYNEINGKHIADRKGKQVKLVSIELEEVI